MDKGFSRSGGYLSVGAAKRGAQKAKHLDPVIVLLGSGKHAGRYDWLPANEPLPEGATPVERWEDGRWIEVGRAKG
ncbi:MAG: hypothetical protein M3Q49_08770 [Actinomycetota bacterium]|nr:hypothetical protein [Actinomycetota bacterium]